MNTTPTSTRPAWRPGAERRAVTNRRLKKLRRDAVLEGDAEDLLMLAREARRSRRVARHEPVDSDDKRRMT